MPKVCTLFLSKEDNNNNNNNNNDMGHMQAKQMKHARMKQKLGEE